MTGQQLLLELFDQFSHPTHAAAAMGASAGSLLNSLQSGVASLDGGLDVTRSDIAAEAYGLFQIHLLSQLAEVALQQAGKGLAVSGLVAGQAVRLRRPAAQ